jgi:SAM-dependent methyltransferase
MLVSYFTPSHDITYLPRVYESLKQQTANNWEWVVVLNGPACGLENDVKSITDSDPRVHITTLGNSGSDKIPIGLLKHIAAYYCRGDLLAELDHDDELSWDCTGVLISTHEKIHADFYYSSCIEYESGKSRSAYSPGIGWTYSKVDFNGKSEIQTDAFPPSPAAFGKIWYAPNHIRVWTSEFYHSINGHDKTLSILDDHEILIRTYLTGNVHFINAALYKYHIHPGNTCQDPAINPGIQTKTLQYYQQHALALAARWSDLNNLKKLDICCWQNKIRSDFVGVDIGYGADVQCDLNKTWPFEDGSVGVIHAQDALEHLSSPVHTMSEIHRVLAPGGWLISNTPSTDGRGAFQDPTHVSFWNSNSFWYYTKAVTSAYIGTPVRFQCQYVTNYYPTQWHNTHNIPYVRADLVKLTGLTDRRLTPGIIEI